MSRREQLADALDSVRRHRLSVRFVPIVFAVFASIASACSIPEAEAQVPDAGASRYWEPSQAMLCFHARDTTGRRGAMGCGRPDMRIAVRACGLCAFEFSARASAAERRTHRDACCFHTVGDY